MKPSAWGWTPRRSSNGISIASAASRQAAVSSGVDVELGAPVRMASDGVGCEAQVPLRHQVGVNVVVGDGAVLVGAGHAVDAKAPARIVVTQRAPQPRGLDEQLEPGLALERLVVGRRLVAPDRVGDVGVDVKGSGSRRPVARTPLAVDRPPGKRRALNPSSLARSRASASVAWRQHSASRAACGAV